MMDNDENIGVGDVVWLKSGGPKMTVDCEIITGSGNFVCIWFHDFNLRRGNFHAATLTRTEPTN